MNKIKTLCIIIITAMLIAVCCSCGAGSDSVSGDAGSGTGDAAADTYITITDQAGFEVTLPTQIDRIAVCDIFPLPSVLSVFFNSAEKIVAMSPTSMSAAENGLLSELYPEILNADTSAISGTDVNIEELMKLDPQVVFYNAATEALGDKLRKAGFNTVAISVNKWEYDSVETLNQWIELLSQIFPDEANNRLELVKQYSDNAISLINERTASLSDSDKKNVFFLFQYSDDSIVTSGRNFFGEWWASKINAVNSGTELTEDNSVKVTLEQIYAWDPDIILITNFNTAVPSDLFDNNIGNYDWSGLTAIQSREAYKMPLGMYRSYTPGVDTPITLLWIAKTVYPQLFEDIDITAETIKYYKDVFGITLTEEQAESIFAPSGNAGQTDF